MREGLTVEFGRPKLSFRKKKKKKEQKTEKHIS